MSFSIAQKLVDIVTNKSINCTVITRFDRKSFIEGAHSLDALKKLISNGIDVFALKNLHTKMYIIDDSQCFTGSANFTTSGLNTNHEILMHFDTHEIDPFNTYVNELLTKIKQSGDWLITLKQVEMEELIVKSYMNQMKEDKRINTSWGANITTPERPDEDAMVLSVPAGNTHHLITKYHVHAHPVSKGYNYTQTDYLAFRRAKGGHMDTIYTINKTISFDMSNWKKEIEGLHLKTSEKENLENYILDRYVEFEFDKAPQYKYKFYLLSILYELPNTPHPPANNPGGWVYTLKDLKESTGIVNTVNNRFKN